MVVRRLPEESGQCGTFARVVSKSTESDWRVY